MTDAQLRDLRWKERFVHASMAAATLAFFLFGLVRMT
jgi:hypothetical protein